MPIPKLPFALAATALTLAAPTQAAPSDKVLAAIDLSKLFATRSPWRFVATQGPDEKIDITDPDELTPGAIRLCLSNDGGRTCRPDLRHTLAANATNDLFADPRYLIRADVVRPRENGRAYLLLHYASMHSVNGNQIVEMRVFAYDRATDRFADAYRHQVGRNNNEEIRYIAQGPLRGAIVSAEPTQNAPFGYWITVSRVGASGTYGQVLRYRSATRYGDGNPLHVIDSEMPGIQQRLGLWHPGRPIPLPEGGCVKPQLRKMVLWCD